jgi:hypothetical protein
MVISIILSFRYFFLLNELNLSLYGKSSTVLDAYDKIRAFEKKLVLWISYVRDIQSAPFPTMESFLVKNDVFVDSEFLERVCNHLKIVKQISETYFPNNFYEKFLWVRDPFQAYNHENNHENDLSLSKKGQLLELSRDGGLKMQFRDLGLSRFWISPSVRSEFPQLYEEALKVAIRFSTTSLCKKGFSLLLQLKTIYRNRLSACADRI